CESGTTFKENAKIKATHARNNLPKQYSDYIVIADDSGMTIDALNGKPGVFTRRWAGYEMTDREIIDYCLEKLNNISNRNASYVSSFCISFPSNKTVIIEDKSDGVILEKVKTQSMLPGMPFRALFYVPKLKMMFHEVRKLSIADRQGYRVGHDEAMKKCIEAISNYI
ncbi:non-canonical purine NTP pyrophosphatase, partial [Candidatus Saccharibacteria bacterium]|nr:non-canonical purine NTP pyrophosphatase [Candidatus Saccharibacteria bacterium]